MVIDMLGIKVTIQKEAFLITIIFASITTAVFDMEQLIYGDIDDYLTLIGLSILNTLACSKYITAEGELYDDFI